MNIQELAADIPSEGEYVLEGTEFINNGEQYLTFMLALEQYAVDILCVEEIRSWEPPTKIPNAPKYIKGVINMRGIIVPIIDLRIKFSVEDITYSETTVVIVLTVEIDGNRRTIGFVVDAVSDVLDIDDKDIKNAPAFGGCVPQHYIDGLVNVGEDVVTILNVETLQIIEKHRVHD